MKLIALLLALTVTCFFSQAQTISHMDVFVQDNIEVSISVDGNDTIRTITTLKEPKMFVVLSDTINISSFTVKLGTTNGGNDIIEKTFTYGSQGQFQDGTSYTRDGIYVRFYLGKYSTLTNYYAQVRATVGGSQQTAINFEGQ